MEKEQPNWLRKSISTLGPENLEPEESQRGLHVPVREGGGCGTYLELEQTYTLLSNAVNLANFWSSETWDQERMGWAWPRSSHHCDGEGTVQPVFLEVSALDKNRKKLEISEL